MPTETDIRIARAVALKAAVDLVGSKAILLADLNEKTEELADLILANGVPARPVYPPSGDPGPQPDEPYDEPSGFQAPPVAPRCGSAPEDTQGCGTEMEYFSGTNASGDDYAGHRCPNQKKTRDPAEQAAEKVRHPVQWQ